ncbi:hypothetical protein GMB86_09165 [Terrilactibacillus sp. BCM23-1]|uniref:Uncharacterized protein n=1 Tax=Terrilactibacillus tamarindi TaxID=2599694 RepID=A0A6N8CSY8_9BACI|nr:hypothetical protein [Terrilactibacillus tamarindi]MTT32173.1 hypothetical protein [Terrilactibacillus tamarindi]
MEQLEYSHIFKDFMERAQLPFNDENVQLWAQIFSNTLYGNLRLPYSDITSAIYRIEDEKLLIIKENLDKISEYVLHEEMEIKDLNKLIDHIELAKVQREYILTNVDELQKQVDKEQDKLNDIKNIKSKIYTEFVGILGIFTAVVLGAFGSLQVIGSVFSNIKDVPTGKLLVFSSVTSLGVISLLFLLMRWISRIVYRDFDKKSWSFSIKDNLIFIMCLNVLGYMFVLGFLLFCKEPKTTIISWLSSGNLGIYILVILTMIMLIILFVCTLIGVLHNNKTNPSEKV